MYYISSVSVLMCDVKSSGRVVGILQRNWRDYVVTFPPRDGTQSQSRNSQRILAVPWDRRIPKIRISTQQADALQVCFAFMWPLIYLTQELVIRKLICLKDSPTIRDSQPTQPNYITIWQYHCSVAHQLVPAQNS